MLDLTSQTFRTPDGKAYLKIDAGRGREVVRIQSDRCRHWLRLKLQKETGDQPTPAELRSTINLLEAHASQSASVAEVHVRVAPAGGRIYIDLADDRGRVVEIGPDGRKVIDTAPVHFLRPDGMRSLPVPKKGGSIEDLRSLINVADDDFVLIVGCLLDGLRGGRSHPVLVLTGAEGTAKSTQLAILACLIDPQPIGGLPATERQLRQVSDRHLFAFDNVSAMPRPVSDALCRLSTTHPIILNGIDDVVTWPDLADRSVFATCKSIPDEQRWTEDEVWAEFERTHARIFGALLDAVAHALRSSPTTRPDKLPRLADLARWVTACEGDLWPPGTFIAAYNKNRAEAAENLIENDALACAVRSLVTGRRIWTGTAAQLQVALGLLDDTTLTPRGLAGRIRNLEPRLRKVGITVDFFHTGHNHDRMIRIARKPDQAGGGPEASSAPSASSADCGDDGGGQPDAQPEHPVESHAANASGGDASDVPADVSHRVEGSGNEPTTSVEELESTGTIAVGGADKTGPADGADDEAQSSISAEDADYDMKASEPADDADDADDEPTFDNTQFARGMAGGRRGPRPPPHNPLTKMLARSGKAARQHDDNEET